jgi:hypothetical protein
MRPPAVGSRCHASNGTASRSPYLVVHRAEGGLAPSYTPPPAYQERGSGLGPMGVLAPEYGLIDRVNVLRGLFDSFAIFYPRMQGEIDLRVLAPELDVPVYVIEALGT